MKNLFILEKETKAIKDRILRGIKNLFENEEEDNYYKPVRVSSKNKCDQNKTVSVEEYLNKTCV